MANKHDDIVDIDPDMDDFEDDDPIPAKRDTRIFQIKKDKDNKDSKDKDDDFEEDVFV